MSTEHVSAALRRGGNEALASEVESTPAGQVPLLLTIRLGSDVEATKVLQDAGYDGVVLQDGGRVTQINAFSPTQIKSAIGNRGTFDPENPNILFSRATIPPGFYSALRRTVEDLKQERLGVDQLRGLLGQWQVVAEVPFIKKGKPVLDAEGEPRKVKRAVASYPLNEQAAAEAHAAGIDKAVVAFDSKSGAKPDEIAWTRLDEFLHGKKSVTKTEVLEWEPISRMLLKPDYEGRLVEFKTKNFSAVTTPDHRWLVTTKSGEVCCKTTDEIGSNGDYRIHRNGDYRVGGLL